MGGAVCPKQLLLDLKDKMNCEVFVGYGTTENSPLTTISTQKDSFSQKTTTVGAVMPHTECKIIDTASGNIVNRGNDFDTQNIQLDHDLDSFRDHFSLIFVFILRIESDCQIGFIVIIVRKNLWEQNR